MKKNNELTDIVLETSNDTMNFTKADILTWIGDVNPDPKGTLATELLVNNSYDQISSPAKTIIGSINNQNDDILEIKNNIIGINNNFKNYATVAQVNVKQNRSDPNLKTVDKTIVGAINELKDNSDEASQWSRIAYDVKNGNKVIFANEKITPGIYKIYVYCTTDSFDYAPAECVEFKFNKISSISVNFPIKIIRTRATGGTTYNDNQVYYVKEDSTTTFTVYTASGNPTENILIQEDSSGTCLWRKNLD